MLSEQEKYTAQFRKFLNNYAPISEDSFAKIMALVKLRNVRKGEFILQKGQTAKKILFICKGILISQWVDDEANVHIKNFFLEGNLAASTVSLLQATASSFGIECVEEGIVIEMNFQKYRQLIYEQDDLKNFYIAYLEQSWIVKNEKRQISFATQSATTRYLNFLKENPTLPARVSQWLIASYLGVTPTQLSRIRKDLKKGTPHQHM
jgi:signal-transduction protein with cAMP-binding, CBS, and nucleotidyltransferase domain